MRIFKPKKRGISVIFSELTFQLENLKAPGYKINSMPPKKAYLRGTPSQARVQWSKQCFAANYPTPAWALATSFYDIFQRYAFNYYCHLYCFFGVCWCLSLWSGSQTDICSSFQCLNTGQVMPTALPKPTNPRGHQNQPGLPRMPWNSISLGVHKTQEASPVLVSLTCEAASPTTSLDTGNWKRRTVRPT